jgi:hypothetical protein
MPDCGVSPLPSCKRPLLKAALVLPYYFRIRPRSAGTDLLGLACGSARGDWGSTEVGLLRLQAATACHPEQ